MEFHGPIVRPPQEDYRQFIEVTVGCTHNSCKFCNFYEGVPFRVAPMEQIERDLQEVARANPDQRFFWANGGNPFALSAEKLAAIGGLFQRYFPGAEIATYARVSDFEQKSVDDLRHLRGLGYDKLVVGVESGDDEVLSRMNKGYAAHDIVEQFAKLDQVGIAYRIVYLSGLAGRGACVESARRTLEVFNRIHPMLIGITSLTVLPGTPLFDEMRAGTFEEASERERLTEARTLLAGLENPTLIAIGPSDDYARLPEDRQRLIGELDALIEGMSDEDERRISRLRHSMRHV